VIPRLRVEVEAVATGTGWERLKSKKVLFNNIK
jgi:hypothetical protein